MTLAGRRIEIQGRVQGVGFRPRVWRIARALGVRGRVWNDAAGVTIEAFAEEDRLVRLVEELQADPPRAAEITRLTWSAIQAEAPTSFAIVPSVGGGERRASIPPDLATCQACLAEVRDPADRRYRYPFTNCTDCGPRLTIALDVPYDRAATTMAPFRMCAACQREYDDPADRRFHAQPNACPACGPRLQGADPLTAATAALRAGRIVAIQGLGGFHLACDATSEEAVARLRERKRREEKPFAVMVADLAAAREIALVDEVAERLLAGVERPIVLLPWRGTLAPSVAPGAPRVGLMLPYTPLHHLLLADVGRPLVMTSGNVAGEPIATRPEALQPDVADLVLHHDRAIATRADDSVATVIAGAPVLIRRSRGFVPRPVPAVFPEPVLAVGAHLKNVVCLGVGDAAWLGPHVGDLHGLAAYEALGEAVERLEAFLGVRPDLVAHDLHPAYLSTRYARERGGTLVAVQHHHAHVAGAMAEHGLSEAIGVAYDGTGLGLDGTSWGAEVLVGGPGSFERAATWRPVRLAGGDRAIRQPWRVALAWLLDAFDGDPPPVLHHAEAAAVRRQLALGLNAPLAHGMGRKFDALAALVLGRPHVAYEGQLATAWEHAAGALGEPPYPFVLEGGVVDDRPLLREAVADLRARVPAGVISARFHAAVVAATVEIVRRIRAERGPLPVVLTGGCFLNARLCEGLLAALPDVRLHRLVPPGDGGLALGQAVCATTSRVGRPTPSAVP